MKFLIKCLRNTADWLEYPNNIVRKLDIETKLRTTEDINFWDKQGVASFPLALGDTVHLKLELTADINLIPALPSRLQNVLDSPCKFHSVNTPIKNRGLWKTAMGKELDLRVSLFDKVEKQLVKKWPC